jgi:antitoxin component YwqK of YwqJK toxin-antitoxin module
MPKPSEASSEIAHYPNGNVKFRGAYLDGEMHGDWEWFRTDGSRMRTGAFNRGKQIGVWRTYDRSGEIVKETDFSKGS